MAPLSPIRIVQTTHRADGASIIASDTTAPLVAPFGPAGPQFSTLATATTLPVANGGAPDATTHEGIPRPPAGGLAFCACDYAPRSSARMHRTRTADYTFVVSGEIVCELDGGEEITLRAGETLVQRGTAHNWHNRTDEVCRLVFVMVAADLVTLENGKVMDDGLF